jgi:hypothetical protein
MINVIEEVRECIRFLSLSLSLCVWLSGLEYQ